MSEHPAEKDAVSASVDRARVALDSVPWWQPFKRQDAARRYRYALLTAALMESIIPPDRKEKR